MKHDELVLMLRLMGWSDDGATYVRFHETQPRALRQPVQYVASKGWDLTLRVVTDWNPELTSFSNRRYRLFHRLSVSLQITPAAKFYTFDTAGREELLRDISEAMNGNTISRSTKVDAGIDGLGLFPQASEC